MQATDNVRQSNLEEMRDNGRLVTVLSALIIVMKQADINLDKVNIGGSDLIIKQPFVVMGALGFILIYLCIRLVKSFLEQITQSILTETSPPKNSNFRSVKSVLAQFLGHSYVGFALVLGLFELVLFAFAVSLSWHDIIALGDLLLGLPTK